MKKLLFTLLLAAGTLTGWAITPVDGVYQIGNATDFAEFAALVNATVTGTTAYNAVVTADFTVSGNTMIGSSGHAYKGTFDGQGHTITVTYNVSEDECALFRRVNDATIKNLHVTGTITTTARFAAGVVSQIHNTGTLLNCLSSVTITDNQSGDATHGGVCATLEPYKSVSNVTIKHCAFIGKIEASNRNGCGGVIGWCGESSGKVTVSHCLMAGTLNLKTGDNNQVVARDGLADLSFISNCYYTNAYSLNTTSGCALVTVAGLSDGTYGNSCADCDGHVLKDNVCLFCGIGYEDSYYIVKTGKQLKYLANYINGNTEHMSDNIRLYNNIDMTGLGSSWYPIGVLNNEKSDANDGNNAYKGIFDGKGYTINNLVQSSENTNNNQGLFGVVTGGCKIQNLVIGSGCKFYGHKYVGAFVGSSRGSSSGVVTIENCGNEADVKNNNATVNNQQETASNAAAFIGVVINGGPGTIIRNCYNTGNISGTTNTDNAILTGWFGNNTNVTVENFYNIGTVSNNKSGDSNATTKEGELFRDNQSHTLVNAYHTSANQGATAIGTNWQTSGKLCYKLGHGTTSAPIWKQTIGTDNYPKLFGATGVVKEVVADESYSNLTVSDSKVQIGTPANLTQFSKEVNAGNTSMNAELTDDITAESGFAPIGNSSHKYGGDFDGNEKTVTLAINNTTTDNQGLFGMATGGANIHDLIVAGSVKGNRYVAGVIGKAQTGHVQLQNVINKATITGNSSADYPDAAGLVGCVASSTYITVTNCGNTGAVSGKNDHCTALCGWSQTGSTYTNCWNIGNISNVSGSNQLYRNEGTLNNCFDASASASRRQGTLLNSGAAASGELAIMLNTRKTSGNDWYQAIGTDSYPVPFSSHDALSVTPATDGWYEISEPWQLRWMAEQVNENNSTYKDANIRLMENIDYKAFTSQYAMFGKTGIDYKGTFNGQYNTVEIAFVNNSADETALFRRVSDTGTIQNLKVTGTISTNKSWAAGIVSGIWRQGIITNCESNVTITDTKDLGDSPTDDDRDATHSGILARISDTNSTGVKVSNCLFSGTINAEGRIGCAGIVGWSDNNSKNEVKNCLVTGTLNVMGNKNNEVIVRSKDTTYATTDNNYYVGEMTGINKTTSPTAVTNSFVPGELCYKLNRNTQGGTNWTQTLTEDSYPIPFNTREKVYMYSDAFYTNMEASDGKILIGSADDLVKFSSFVNGGKPALNAELKNDIDMIEKSDYVPIGTDGYKYAGTFDGGGKCIRNLVISTNKKYIGLFGYLTSGADIKNLIIDSTCSFTGDAKVGGVSGMADGGGEVKLSNIINAATIESTGSKDANAAGLIGCAINGTSIIATNCANMGNVSNSGYISGETQQCAAFAGWTQSNTYFTNCWNSGTINNMEYSNDLSANCNLYRNTGGVTATNCYDASATSNCGQGTLLSAGAGASGELCYRLNGSEDNGTDWYQDLSQEGYPIPFGTKTVAAGKWFNSSDNDVYYNKEGDDYTVYQLNMSDTQTEYNVPDDGTVTAKNVKMARNLSAGKWNTFCSPVALPKDGNFSAIKELTGVSVNGDHYTMTFSDASSIVAGKPYMVQVSEAKSELTATDATLATAVTPVTIESGSNSLTFTGVFAKGDAPLNSFIISNNAFYLVDEANTVNLGAFRGYITTSSGSSVKALSFEFEDMGDGINSLTPALSEGEGAIYNVAGQRIQKMQKGINIVNGKKIMK